MAVDGAVEAEPVPIAAGRAASGPEEPGRSTASAAADHLAALSRSDGEVDQAFELLPLARAERGVHAEKF
jgi:hypothetical protein